MFTKATAFCVVMTAAVCLSASAQTGPNGTEARPFYVIGHNPNTISDAILALENGANMIEPDLVILPAGSHDPGFNPNPTGIVVYHDAYLETKWIPNTLEKYLYQLHEIAPSFPNLVAIMLDIKSSVAEDPANGQKILDAVRENLNIDGVNLYVIYNVGSIDDAKVFDNILGQLNDNEGVQIDGEDRADLAVAAVAGAKDDHIGFGDGTLTIAPNLPRQVDFAAFLRASTGLPKTISDVYTIMRSDTMEFFIDAGADGIIPDWPDGLHPEFDPLITPGYVKTLSDIVKGRTDVRLATKDDNPFKPLNQAYGLEFRTFDGTNADLTFTLNGCRGSAELTYNTGFIWALYSTLRMEATNTDYATIPSLDLGKLTSLHIVNHGGGTGGYPEWGMQDVAVSSAKYLGQDYNHAFEYQGTVSNVLIPGNSSLTVPLAPNFTEPAPTIQCPAPITVNNAPGQCGAPVNFQPQVAGMCPDVTATSTPPSGATFAVGTTSVNSIATSLSVPGSSSCTFAVTVVDAEGPQISCPAPMTIDATNPLGAIATFAPLATDNCSVASVTSVPAPGSVFAIGTTTVNNVARDGAGHEASCAFTVHVKGAAEQLADLAVLVQSLQAKQGVAASLLAKLDAALAKVSSQSGAACGDLTAFVNEVEAQRDKEISALDADALIAKATQIRSVLGC